MVKKVSAYMSKTTPFSDRDEDEICPREAITLHQYEVIEISLDKLCAADNIYIRTTNSTYIFVVTDPKDRFGVLMGGVFDNKPVPAMLVGVEQPTGSVQTIDNLTLRKGSRAFFFTGPFQTPGRLLTSVIQSLSYGSQEVIEATV